MNVATQATSATATRLATIAFVAILGAGLIFTAGFANSATLHNATHDSRHAVGFPCH